MDGARFDTWTRRRFGRVTVGALAGSLGLAAARPSLARNKKRGKKRQKPCEKLGTRCNPNNDAQLCCGVFYCQIVPELGGHRCCKTLHLACSRDADCCGNLSCVGDEGARSCRTGP